MGNVASALLDYIHNQWQQPVEKFGDGETRYKNQICSRFQTFSISKHEWETACTTIDQVLEHLLCDLKNLIQQTFPGLTIENYVKQGSSREGLKVKDPNEFDCILPFLIDDMELSQTTLQDEHGNDIPGLIKLKALNGNALKSKYSWIERYEIFDFCTNYVNGKALQRRIFTKAFDRMISKPGEPCTINGETLTYCISSIRPPTIELKVKNCFSSSTTVIFVDMVPGILISSPSETCHRYAVMKWVNKKTNKLRDADHEFVWRDCSSGYEKMFMDTCREERKNKYIMTSCRIVKTYMTTIDPSTNQLGALFKSYQLKNICMYCLLYLQDSPIRGVKEALGYFICFMEIALNKGELPHFFLGNYDVDTIISDCYFAMNYRTYNLLNVEDDQRLIQARSGFDRMKQALRGLYTEKEELDQQYYNRFLYKIDLTSEFDDETPCCIL